MLRAVIQRPIAVTMLFLALVLIGALSYRRLPVDLLPSITYPRLTVITPYEDIPAEGLERLVTQPLEEVVTALSGVRRVVSRTREGISNITVEYEWGTQMDFANLHLREAVTVVDQSQSQVAPSLVVERFLQAVNTRNLETMSRLFGTEDGPFGDRRDKEETELRMDALVQILMHDDYQIRSESKQIQFLFFPVFLKI